METLPVNCEEFCEVLPGIRQGRIPASHVFTYIGALAEAFEIRRQVEEEMGDPDLQAVIGPDLGGTEMDDALLVAVFDPSGQMVRTNGTVDNQVGQTTAG